MRVADIIRGQIRAGELRPGERLPAFPDLCRQYGVSNITIRGAIRSLSEEGLIIREERKGVFVAILAPLAAIAASWFAARWIAAKIGGYTGDTLGAIEQKAELVFLVVAALFIAH